MPVSKKRPMPSRSDEALMARALQLANRGEGRVEPNPMVGCVIVRKDRVIGEGYHRRFGGPHAEIESLRQCKNGAGGATVYVTLEPCCYHGKTPPCTDALIKARVARVVVGVRDPHPNVRGKGLRQLRKAGIEVATGMCETDARELIAPFSTHVKLKRPYVIAKWAQSLDGRLATETGDSKWISSQPSRRRVHQMRARVDAVLVGVGTVLIDDPLLTARNVTIRRRALRIVLDSRLRTPTSSRLVLSAGDWPVAIFTTAEKATSAKAKRLRKLGVDVIGCRANRGRIAIKDWLRKLADRDVTNLLVEGGPTLLSALLQDKVVDEARIFTAPTLIGGKDNRTAIHGPAAARIESAITARTAQISRSGIDVLHRLRLTDPL